MSYILGISSFYHDSASALIKNGEIVAAAQEERFTRKKHDANFPENSIKYVLKEANINLDDLDYIVFYEKPLIKFERLIETYVGNAPRGFKSFKTAIPIWIKEKLFQKNIITNELKKISKTFKQEKLLFSEHHQSHAASAFYPSPFNEAIILTIDGVGEWATTTISIGNKNLIKIIKEIHFPHSLGLLYSAFTYYLGFKVNSGEYKLMGLAPYGIPKYKKKILDNLIFIKKDGSFILDQSFFNYSTGLTMTNKKFVNLFGQPVRKNESEELTQFHMDIAASIQSVIEDVILKITNELFNNYNIPNLCLAGGVALNCVANSKILKQNKFKNIWVQPAAGDAGGALGAALLTWYNELKNNRAVNNNDSMKGAYLGPKYNADEIQKSLSKLNAKFKKFNDNVIIEKTANFIKEGKAVGWFQGRMEFGPRALGARSIIADPRSSTMKKILNLKIKYRESFRPFAPSILREELHNWFELDQDSDYMLFVGDVKKEIRLKISESDKNLLGIDKLYIKNSLIPAVTHVDFSSRIQTVNSNTNPKYHSLLSYFNKITNCPILVNTSFNIRGEPIVCSPSDAFNCFMGTDLDILVIENFILVKDDQIVKDSKDYQKKYPLD